MHAKFQVAGFQNKRNIRHFLLCLLGQATWWFLAIDSVSSEIQASVDDLKPIN